MDTVQQIVADTTAIVAEQGATSGINVWMIVALAELVIIIGLLLSHNKNSDKRAELKRKILAEGDMDIGNTMNSMFNAEPLYRELIRKCHPDRFAPDEEKMAAASELSMRITKNKHDIKILEALRQEAVDKLNINI